MADTDLEARANTTSAVGTPFNTDALMSIDSVMTNAVEQSSVDQLPDMLLQMTAIQTSAWAHTAKVLHQIRDSNIWETVDDGKYAGNWDGFLRRYTEGQGFTSGWASKVMGYRNWIIDHHTAIMDAKPEDCTNVKPKLPRESTMGIITNYEAAFNAHPALLALIFWEQVTNKETILGEIRERMGVGYIGGAAPMSHAQQRREQRRRTYTQTGPEATPEPIMPQPAPRRTFGAPLQSADAEALLLVRAAQSVYDHICNQGTYSRLTLDQRISLRDTLVPAIEAAMEYEDKKDSGAE